VFTWASIRSAILALRTSRELRWVLCIVCVNSPSRQESVMFAVYFPCLFISFFSSTRIEVLAFYFRCFLVFFFSCFVNRTPIRFILFYFITFFNLILW
jgi:hypothetical protein